MTIIEIALWVIAAYVAWKLVIGRWLAGTNAFKTLRSRIDANKISDEAYYEMAGEEISRGKIRTGIWLKALSEAEGNESRAQAIYLKLRVDAMRQEFADALHAKSGQDDSGAASTDSAQPQKITVTCPTCGGLSRVKSGATLDVTCPHCRREFRVTT